jgi:hypothetical protein
MEPPRDFCELLELFNASRVKALIVGAYALAYHGAPRMTGDLDLFVEPAAENAKRVIEALSAFGFGDIGLTAEDFQRADTVVQLGLPPVRVDLLTGITGVSWEDAWAGRVDGELGTVPAAFIGLAELRRNKRATGRHRDLADLEALGDEA